MLRMKGDNLAGLAWLAAMSVIVACVRLFFEDRTAFWWFSSVNFCIGYILMTNYSFYLYVEGRERGRKGALARRLIFAAFFAPFWIAGLLAIWGDRMGKNRSKTRTCH